MIIPPDRFQKTVLNNGLRVLSERHPESQAACVAINIAAGTRDENPRQMGISHLLEHMVFKGTKNYSAYQIVRALESVGGEINAYTSREQTTYHTLTLSEDWPMALTVLTDLVRQAKFPDI